MSDEVDVRAYILGTRLQGRDDPSDIALAAFERIRAERDELLQCVIEHHNAGRADEIAESLRRMGSCTICRSVRERLATEAV